MRLAPRGDCIHWGVVWLSAAHLIVIVLRAA